MDPVITDGLRVLAGVAFFFVLLPYAGIKLIDYEARQSTHASHIAGVDWLDPDLRQN